MKILYYMYYMVRNAKSEIDLFFPLKFLEKNVGENYWKSFAIFVYDTKSNGHLQFEQN